MRAVILKKELLQTEPIGPRKNRGSAHEEKKMERQKWGMGSILRDVQEAKRPAPVPIRKGVTADARIGKSLWIKAGEAPPSTAKKLPGLPR